MGRLKQLMKRIIAGHELTPKERREFERLVREWEVTR